jgi:hypothetical protein
VRQVGISNQTIPFMTALPIEGRTRIMREPTLPKLMTKKEVLEVVPVTFSDTVGVDAEGRVSGCTNGRNPADVARK